MNEIIIIGESLVTGDLQGCEVHPGVFELMAWARRMGRDSRSSVRIILPGRDMEAAAGKLAWDTGLPVTALNFPRVESYNSELYLKGLLKELEGMTPGWILLAHTAQGRELAPLLAVELQAACIPGINAIQLQEGAEPVFSRAVYGGGKNRQIRPVHRPVVLTIQPGMVKPLTHPGEEFYGTVDGLVTISVFDESPGRILNMGMEMPVKRDTALLDAGVIVAAGRGIGEKENLARVFEFADLFPNSAVAASRPLIDQGWLPYPRQVGITGASVAPRVYIALGISGSTQHLAGIRDADYVIAVNIDPHAAIFNHADLCIVGDVFEFMAEVKGESINS